MAVMKIKVEFRREWNGAAHIWDIRLITSPDADPRVAELDRVAFACLEMDMCAYSDRFWLTSPKSKVEETIRELSSRMPYRIRSETFTMDI